MSNTNNYFDVPSSSQYSNITMEIKEKTPKKRKKKHKKKHKIKHKIKTSTISKPSIAKICQDNYMEVLQENKELKEKVLKLQNHIDYDSYVEQTLGKYKTQEELQKLYRLDLSEIPTISEEKMKEFSGFIAEGEDDYDTSLFDAYETMEKHYEKPHIEYNSYECVLCGHLTTTLTEHVTYSRSFEIPTNLLKLASVSKLNSNAYKRVWKLIDEYNK